MKIVFRNLVEALGLSASPGSLIFGHKFSLSMKQVFEVPFLGNKVTISHRKFFTDVFSASVFLLCLKAHRLFQYNQKA